MPGRRRIGGQMYPLDGEGDCAAPADRPKLYSPGLRRGYQVRRNNSLWEVWYVEYHQTSHRIGVTSEQCHGIFSTEHAAELFARRLSHA